MEKCLNENLFSDNVCDMTVPPVVPLILLTWHIVGWLPYVALLLTLGKSCQGTLCLSGIRKARILK